MGVLAPSLDPRQPTGLLLGEGFEQVNEDLVVESPYTGEPVARVAVGTADHVALAVEAARAAGIVRGRAELFAQTIATEAGKPLRQARAEVARCTDTLTFSAARRAWASSG